MVVCERGIAARGSKNDREKIETEEKKRDAGLRIFDKCEGARASAEN